MTEEAATKVIRRFTKAAEELEGARMDVKTLRNTFQSACGEFGISASTGADTFEISWSEFFDIAGDSARVIAKNTNQTQIDLANLDGNHTPGN